MCVRGHSWKILGFYSQAWSKVDKDKKGIMAMQRPKSQKQLKSFFGKISYLRIFILALTELSHLLTSFLKFAVVYYWTEEHQTTFENIKKALTSTGTMIPPKRGIPCCYTSHQQLIPSELYLHKKRREWKSRYIILTEWSLDLRRCTQWWKDIA